MVSLVLAAAAARLDLRLGAAGVAKLVGGARAVGGAGRAVELAVGTTGWAYVIGVYN